MNTVMRHLLCSFLLAPAIVFAQLDGAELRVKGVVRESGTGIPIQGARVSLMEGRSSTTQGHEDSRLVARTGIDGKYAITVPSGGAYSARVSADGYVARDFSRFFRIGGQSPSTVTLDFDLLRTATLSGHILDSATDKPVPAIRVSPRRALYDRGQLTIGFQLDAKPALTDSTGAFRIEGLLPGEYVLELESTDSREVIRRGKETQERSETQGYRHQWWPGGAGPERALPFALRPGADFSIPNLRLSRTESYRITAHLPIECADSDQLQADLSVTYGHSVYSLSSARFPCGENFTVVNVSPGEYDVHAMVKRAGLEVHFHRQATVIDRDIDLELSTLTPIVVHGHVDLPKSFPDALRSKLSLAGEARGGEGSVGGFSARIGEDGSFRLDSFPGTTLDVALAGMPAQSPFYMSEVVYNGTQVRDGLLSLNSHAVTHTLTVKLSDKAGALRGKVLLKGEPFPNSSVVLVPWPLRMKGASPVYFRYLVDSDGAFAIGGLAPEEYHVIALPTNAWEGTFQKPGELAALAARGVSVSLRPSGSQEVVLDLTWIAADF